MTLRKAILLFSGLSLIAIWLACSSSSAPTIAISATSGNNQSVEVGTAFAALQATVTKNGSPDSGASVTFTVNPASNGASCTFANGTGTETDTANSSGVATSSACTANGTAGSFTVTASTSGTTSTATFNLTSTPVPINVSIVSGNNQSTTVGQSFQSPLEVNVTTNGTATSGVNVVFTIVPSAGGAGATFANGTAAETDMTDANGNATTSTPTANTVAGSYTVTATYSGVTATFNESNIAGTPVNLAITGGNNQSVATGATYASLVAQVTDSDGNGVQGVSIQFTVVPGATGAGGTFTSTSSGTETVNTDANGNATVSDLVANSTTGAFTVTAAPTTVTLTPPSVTFNETNITPTTLGNGTYVFSLSGLDTDDYSLFYVAGAFTVSGGAITGGEQDYVDFVNYGIQDQINPTGSSITTTSDGNLQLVLTTCLATNCTETDSVVGVSGVETLNLTLRPSKPTQGYAIEFDASGTADGSLKLQDATAAAATPSAGYAFQVAGLDGGEIGDGTIYPLNVGGIINVDGVGTISGSGSIFDANDDSSGTTYQAETFAASTVSAPDTFGRVTFTLNPTDTTDFPQIILVGYIVDSSRIALVETADNYGGTTGGSARSQGSNTGTFSSASVSGSTYGAAMTGFDAHGPLQSVGALTFNSGGTVTGFIDFNDLVSTEPASPDPVSAPSYTVDSTGRVTISGLTDGVKTTINLQLYIDGSGNAVAITLDTKDNQGSFSAGQINNTGVTDANFNGPYALVAFGWDGSEIGEFGAVGPITATGTGDTFSGFADINYFSSATTTAPAADEKVSGTYAVSADSGILTGTITGLDIDSTFLRTDTFNFYQVDTSGSCVAIEVDKNQITLGFFQP